MAPVILLMLMVSSFAFGADAPRTPCAGAPNPSYAGVDQNPSLGVWVAEKGVSIDSRCTPGLAGSFRLAAALSGRFRSSEDAAGLLTRLGAVSRMQGVRYWSVGAKRWAELVTRSSALTGLRGEKRADFTAAEMRPGRDLFFAQRDAVSTGEVGYRMRVVQADKAQIIVEVENVTPLKYIVTLFEPGELRTAHFLTLGPDNVWNYYLLTTVDGARAESHRSSVVNRAAALYRQIAGQQTDREPPLAPHE